jgi:FkbM family methyltransferase
VAQIEAIKSKNGKTYWIERGDTLYSQRLRSGQYQRTNWDFAQTIIPQFRRCIDIGSNNAVNAIHYAERFEWVECFEPTQLAQQLWHNTVRDNAVTNCTLHTEALGEDTRTTEIILHERNGGHNHLWHYDKNPRAKEQNLGRATHQVSQTTLDAYHFDHVDFVKIDVEGYEIFVVKGALQTIQKHRPIFQLEIVANQCRKFDYHAEDIIELFRTLDYRVLSKRDGWLDGVFTSSCRSDSTKGIYHNGVKRRGDMDLFFVPQEHNTNAYGNTFGELFEIHYNAVDNIVGNDYCK